MSGRGGLPVKNILYAVVALFLVYMLYVYHGSQGRLHEAEMTGARYKREVEERVSEIQDLVKGHDKFQETCQKEKRELQNSITSVNTKYKMLESHQRDTEADLNTMKQHMETMKQEHSDAYTQHAQEFQALKQEKENEIARIKDQLADATRRNVELENKLTNLRQKLQEGEVLSNKFLDCSASLKTLEETLAGCQQSLKAAELQNLARAEQPKVETRNRDEEERAGKLDSHKDGPYQVNAKKEETYKVEAEKDKTQKNLAEKGETYKNEARKGKAITEVVEREDTHVKDVHEDAILRGAHLPEDLDMKANKTSEARVNDTLDVASLNKSGRNQLIEENARLQQTLVANQLRAAEAHVGVPQEPARLPGNNAWLPKDSAGLKQPDSNVFGMKVDSPLKDLDHDGVHPKNYGKDVVFKPEGGLKPVGGAHQDADLGQVLPPKLNPDSKERSMFVEDKEKDMLDAHDKPGVNPNDEQKGQILEPFFPNKDKDDETGNAGDDREDGVIGEQDGGGEEGLGKRNAREEEEEREAGARREEEGEGGDGLDAHQNPLALRQLELPGHLDSRRKEVEADEEEMNDRGGPGAGAGVGQQLPPAMDNREVDNQYFGEVEEEDRQMAEEQDGNNNNNNEEEEEEEEEDGEEAELDNQEDELGEEHVNEDMAGQEGEEEEEDKRMLPFN
ncbi:Golgi integral membrane protein 4 [Elysia marginata]|uniref:Golgi integral membrane protein 4 n=1 Tax=Elysia marginata TaxID=1093978 RepID=A0AAV4IJM8_9GAST|nr:Golgi integral membrane protein 4 [Elysia marginata]